MANAFMDTAQWTLLTSAAYDREVNYQLRNSTIWRQMVDYSPQAQAMPGTSVVLSLLNEFTALATTPLTEDVDPDAVQAPAPTQKTVTLNEYGNATLQSDKLRNLSFIEVNTGLVNLIAKNLIDTIDALVQAVVDTSTNIVYINGGAMQDATTTVVGTEVAVTATDTFGSGPASAAAALLRRRKVTPKDGLNYVAVIHPDVALDFRRENATNAWIAPHAYQDTANVYNGEIGTFAGARYVESTRVRTALDGASSGKVYSTYVLGQQALVEATAVEPHVVIGNQVDKLNRFFPIGWKGTLGWSIYRPEAIQVVRSSSSIAKL